MKKVKFLFIIAGIFLASRATGQFNDSFTDGDFQSAPVWSGDATKFVVQSERLRLLAPANAGSAQLATESHAIHTGQWEFSLQMEFTPSSSNYANVFLVADQPDLKEALNGYFVRIGNSSREVSLYRRSGTAETELIDGLDDRVNQVVINLRVKVTRNADGNWELLSDMGQTGQFVSEGTIVDEEHLESGWFGLQCVYTSTRSDKFWFDDFVVTGSVVPDQPVLGNPQPKSVLITEVFADPTPKVGLPDVEYIELYNPGPETYNLKNWILSDGSSTGLFARYLLMPGDYLVVTSPTGSSLFNGIPVAVLTNFPSLNNAGDNLLLTDKNGLAIDSVHYSTDWYRDEDKAEGGWSLELIDPSNPCGEEGNWTASEDKKGGTPGQVNSVFANKPDLTPPEVLKVRSLDSMSVAIDFNETLGKTTIPGIRIELSPIIHIDNVILHFSRRQFEIKLSKRLQKGQPYRLRLSGVTDCSGNLMPPVELFFGLAEPAESHDMLLSEVLFNPRSGGVDFVEIHNGSKKFIDLENWTISNGSVELPLPAIQVPPGTLLALTADPEILRFQYPVRAEAVVTACELPSLPDDESHLIIYDENQQVMDSLTYEDDWHLVFLSSTEGVSLERISYSFPSHLAENWTSAASWSGFATPGSQNSNHRNGTTSGAHISVVPEIFSPGTGPDGFVQIHYRYERPGVVANFRIFDQHGVTVKVLASNASMGNEGFLRWDGDKDNGSMASAGYYVLWAESFDVSGHVETVRTRIVIASR